ncbi:MAG: U32 family peptidase, partial [Firmicutes bacterium]|nr:U32 family peptidase [Bacillota bacterium]
MKKMELLAPAGDLEKLKTAVIYGADAIYFGGEAFSLRAGADNFSLEDMREGINFAHERGVRCFMTLNIFPHNEDIVPLQEYLLKIRNLGIDAFIVSDPGMFDLIKGVMANAEIHISTQANTTSYASAKFWAALGVKRFVLARELTLKEIRGIRDNLPEDVELEAFCHGAMCISYSGRCLLSNFMNGRDSNKGMCSHPCRWKYALVEEKRPGEYYPIEEDDRGTYIMNSGDLCMIEHIADLAEAGVYSLKIEGRMKSIFYVATTVAAYRKAIDDYYAGKPFDESLLEEVGKVSHRKFTTGFFYRQPGAADQDYLTSDYMREYSFVGKVLDYDEATGMATVEQRNKMSLGDEVEIFGPGAPFFA